MFKKVGRALKGFGKKLSDGFKSVKGFGKRLMRGADELGIGEAVRTAGSEIAQTGMRALDRAGVPASRVAMVAEAGSRLSPQQRRDMARGVARESIRMAGREARRRMM